jgi:predicted DNA-binding ribbon-helix-helix protein
MLAPLNELDGSPDGLSISVFVRTRTGRKSVKLGVGTLRALHEIVEREEMSLGEIVSLVEGRRSPRETLAEALRSAVVNYFRQAATEEGHRKAGHGAAPRNRDRAAVRSIRADRRRGG